MTVHVVGCPRRHVNPQKDNFWGLSNKNTAEPAPREGCDCSSCQQNRAALMASWLVRGQSYAKSAELARLLERAEKARDLHWDRVLRQDKTIEELREDRAALVKEASEAMGVLHTVIKDLREQLAAKPAERVGYVLSFDGVLSRGYQRKMMQFVAEHRQQIKEVLGL